MLVKTIEEAKTWINEHKRTPFGVRFIKKDGSIRAMNCETGVKDDDILVNNPYRKGMDFQARGLISVYDTDLKQYRCFKPETLLAIRIDNVWYAIKESQTIPIGGFDE